MDRWKQYLFESHPEATLRDWAKRLTLFRFFRAYGGHANDGDSLDLAYRYETAQDLEKFLLSLGIVPVKYSEKPPQPEFGIAYKADEFVKFPSLVPGTEWIRQPGRCLIAGKPVFVWCGRNVATISIAGAPYTVTEADVQAAQAVEAVLASAWLERVDPPVDTKHYICPKYYPEYFE
ncbi:hypothetical protein ACVCIC_22190 [Burkholderia glumae]|uniref:Uncharacterized protein n=2 Tax=Burkholderia glumae TaxID=337 RepID=A0AAP9Y4I9_BURGL|nr:hypothetical protein [Burkholderia glumae]ACR28551.1 Hypothetical protein bglu_1g14020 [Burkholderia glumae BGR1]AJY67866.1 hypothetical protein KS03_2369 [Burkholderia glumae LMG 2196 = ATCC 33617]MCM2480431.1 hypothetical protein [Burkholderia glumae]MCM2492931.1 hypothetical protein [Burkholderia glumae]MCM2506828.1 hypothetical protein [Burkholderia glumae]